MPTLLTAAAPLQLPFVPLYGDVDGSGRVSIIDATIIQRAKAGLHLLSAFQQELADTDGNGKVSVLDATRIQRYLAAIPSNSNRTGESYYVW